MKSLCMVRTEHIERQFITNYLYPEELMIIKCIMGEEKKRR